VKSALSERTFRQESADLRRRRQEAAAPDLERWARRRAYFHSELARLFRMHVAPGARVLHVGCGLGDTLAATDPADGLGIDLAEATVEAAGRRHANRPNLRFEVRDPEDFEVEGKFDFVIVDHAFASLRDIQAALQCIHRACHADTRLVFTSYNALWGPILRTASALRVRRRTDEQNWLGGSDFDNLLRLSGFEVVRASSETLLPIRVPLANTVFNRFLVRFFPFNHCGLVQLVVARPLLPAPVLSPRGEPVRSVSVIIPTRNERGNIEAAIERLPALGSHTEVIFVDGNSTDGTAQEIERVIAAHPGRDIRLIHQGTGKGKGDAVRKGFAAAKGDVLMILDADLTVPPEDLPRFLAPIADGTAEFINGTRLVYPMEEEAMRFLNRLGNRFFSLLFTWLLGQRFRDTLCGTKVLARRHYELIAANRSFFGDFDPFGDFDLIFGAARANLRIIEVPVRYRARTYGETNIHRFRHGWLLLQMSWVAFRKLKLR